MKTITISRKLTLYPQGDKKEVDRVYAYIRNGMKVQALMMNTCITAMYIAKINGASDDEWKELRRQHSHVPTSSKGSPYDFDMSLYPTGLPLAGGVPRNCEQDLKKAIRDGLLKGKVSLPTYKNTAPLYVHNDYVDIMERNVRANGLYHDYDSFEELEKALTNDLDPKVHIRFPNGIVFDVVLGNPYKSAELRSSLIKAFSGEYKICDSTIGFDQSGKKIQLNLALQFNTDDCKLDEDTVVGVDLGLAIPVMCALNNNLYKRTAIGSLETFLKERLKIQAELRRIRAQLRSSRGGHGRAKKLTHLEKIKLHERNFVHTQNHYFSSKVIGFARANHAKFINIEKLSGFDKKKKKEFVLRNWSYYELQQMIIYKAAKFGIEVRMINPAYTSQTCSYCGEKGDRESQSVFKCLNPNCKCHKEHPEGINADFNAARNIAMSTDFVDSEEIEETETA